MRSEVGNCIYFANDILKNEKIIKGELKVNYSLMKYKQTGSYDIMRDISENVTLFQLIDLLVNVNHYISVVGYWIFDSKYEKALVLNRASLDMICALYFGEEQAAKFELVLTEVRYILSEAQLKKGCLWCISQNTIISYSFAI